MPIFNKIITLSKQLAASLLKDEEPTALNNSDLFDQKDKEYILSNLTDETLIKNRLELINQINEQADWKKVKSKIQVPVRKLIIWRYAAAAILVIALASTYFLRDTIFNSNIETTTPIIVNNQIEPGVDKATLTLEDGSQVALEKGTAYQTQNATSNGEEIVYTSTQGPSPKSHELIYNTLTIPRGGQFQMTLSDGTKVWLNSETQLKYPVSFTDGEPRQVELIYGEAYFEVSPSTEHKGSNFKVFNNRQQVEVLGTKFNFKAYKDESNIYTTLVEGSVRASSANAQRILSPNQQSILDIQDGTLRVQSVDVYDEVAWTKGVFSFKDMRLGNIMRVLSRWYDMEVTFTNPEIRENHFTGVLGKEQSITDILTIISSTKHLNYEIKDRTITFK